MSESLPPEKGANDRAFGVACWTLGGLAFVLLLMVGVSFSLSVRTVVVEKVVEKRSGTGEAGASGRSR